MAVHTREDKVQVTQMVVQVRYTDGYRFLDTAGEILNEIRNQFPLWSITSIERQRVVLRHEGIQGLLANIGYAAVELSRMDKQSLVDAERFTKELGEQSEHLYNLVVEELAASSTMRVDVRYHFFAPADSLEESDRVVCAALRSPYEQKVGEMLETELVEGTINLLFDEPQTGIRRSIQTYSVILDRPPGSPEYLGLGKPTGSGGILIDIDTFARPTTGHFPKLGMFVQEQFLKSKKIALALMKWIIQPTK